MQNEKDSLTEWEEEVMNSTYQARETVSRNAPVLANKRNNVYKCPSSGALYLD